MSRPGAWAAWRADCTRIAGKTTRPGRDSAANCIRKPREQCFGRHDEALFNRLLEVSSTNVQIAFERCKPMDSMQPKIRCSHLTISLRTVGAGGTFSGVCQVLVACADLWIRLARSF